jgi:uncharacterized membrane protein YeaQ/YmgE (transglycosylase-associated protein family)
MKRRLNFGVLFVFAMVCLLAGWIARVEAKQEKQAGNAVQMNSGTIGGVVASSKGPEAGVWVVAETNDLGTKFVKIVVTNDQGRYLIPELPQATYQVWVRGYGLVDSTPVQAAPGKQLNLTAVIAPSAKEAAKYYPAVYWLSLIKVPDKSEFPMKPTPMPPFKGETAGAAPAAPSAITPIAQRQGGGMAGQPAVPNEEALELRPINTQEQWIDVMKQGCQQCHQLGDDITRDLGHLNRLNFNSPEQAWATRIHFGQAGTDRMSNTLTRFVDQQRAIKMFADWTDRIAAGELPPAPPRPQGPERNLVVTLWDWGKTTGHPHDEISTDKRHPSVNAYGLVYGADFNDDDLLWVDPVKNTAGAIGVPTIADKSSMTPTWPKKIAFPSPIYGNSVLWKGVGGPHNPMMDEKGRVWVTSNVRPAENPDFCKAGSDSPFAQYFPLATAGKHAAVYDPETKKFTPIDTCFNTHHLQFGFDKDNTLYFSGPGGQAFGWLNTRVYDQTGDPRKAMGWCPAYIDTNGDGKIDPAVDKRIPVNGYGAVVNPLDGSIWFATTGPTPGHLLRMTLGSNPPATCMAEVYEPPFYNPKRPGVSGFAPRGVDIDRKTGLIWTALSGSGQLASFDRSKCKVLNGPTATGQQCPEGWTLYTAPGPKMKGVTDESSADFEYYNWVDQFNTLGLGENIPLVTGTSSDSLQAFDPNSKKWTIMRVPYPMGFFVRGMDGRIDDPKAGWKGRGVYATYGPDMTWHIEGGAGSKNKLVKFQFRPDPLAD